MTQDDVVSIILNEISGAVEYKGVDGMKTKALYRGMELTIYGYKGFYADCYIKELDRRQDILISDIEVVGL